MSSTTQSKKTFSVSVAGIDFQVNRLRMRQQEEVSELLGSFREARESGYGQIRKALEICVHSWAIDRPLSDIDDELDLRECIELVSLTLAGNQTSEDDRKK